MTKVARRSFHQYADYAVTSVLFCCCSTSKELSPTYHTTTNTLDWYGQIEVQQQLMQMNLQLHQQQLQLELLQRQMQQQQIMARVWQSPWAPAPRSGGSQSLQLEGWIGAMNNQTNAPDAIQPTTT